jgi:hypothetical protein
MCKRVFLLLCLASYSGSFLTAQGNSKSNTNNACDAALADAQFGLGNGDTKSAANNPNGNSCSISWTMPVWSEIVNLSYPIGFHPDYEKTHGGHYMIELVPKGETANQWSQMVTVTGEKGLSANPNFDESKKFSYAMASGFKRYCPDTSSLQAIGPTKISGHDAYVAWAGCGTVIPDGSAPRGESIHSESAMIVSIRGTNDYYMVQWAERGPASSQPLVFDISKWENRLLMLYPIKICPIVPGEAAPYPSCADKKPVTLITAIKPIFSELLSYSYPSEFHQSSGSTKNNIDSIVMLPDGETESLYAQKITLIGVKDYSALPNMTALKSAQLLANGWKIICSDTYSSKEIGPAKVSGHDAYIEWASCGTLKLDGGVHSESFLMVSILGKEDRYTIQWEERGPASSHPIVYDEAKWKDRLKELIPIKICPLVPGEHEPYSSCVNQK